MPMRYRVRRRNMTGPVLFFAFLAVMMILTICNIFLHTGPIILGTEMNANGHVEYLCLGNGCDRYSDMFWTD